MKITYDDGWSGRANRDFDLVGAVLHKLTPDPYSYQGSLERAAAVAELQSEMIARLVETLALQMPSNRAEELMRRLLGAGYEVVA